MIVKEDFQSIYILSAMYFICRRRTDTFAQEQEATLLLFLGVVLLILHARTPTYELPLVEHSVRTLIYVGQLVAPYNFFQLFLKHLVYHFHVYSWISYPFSYILPAIITTTSPFMQRNNCNDRTLKTPQ
jgi:hypothetical protein